MSFTLHPQLAADTFVIGDLPLSKLLLMNNANFAWLILVPMRAHMRELFDLDADDYRMATQEVRMASQQLAKYSKAYKINIAALGNQVPQLHIHIIARFETDAAWPNPVWNSGVAATPYAAKDAENKVHEMQQLFGLPNITNL